MVWIPPLAKALDNGPSVGCLRITITTYSNVAFLSQGELALQIILMVLGVKLLLKEFRGLGVSYTQEVKSPYPVHRSVVLAHHCFLSLKLWMQTKGGVVS